MKRNQDIYLTDPEQDLEQVDHVELDWGLNRRRFVQVLGAGLLITVGAGQVAGQRRGPRGGGREARVSARIHIGIDGTITVLSGKIEMGQGARGELSQVAAEELRVPLDRVQMVLGDTGLVPDDGLSAGSRTTPSTVPAVRRGAAAARELLVQLACRRWQVSPDSVEVRDGRITHAESKQSISYGDLAKEENLAEELNQAVPSDVTLTSVEKWQIMGKPAVQPGIRDFVTGSHSFPSDLAPENALRGKVLRAPTYGARLQLIDLGPAQAMEGVVAVRDGDFVGVAAPTTAQAQQALDAIAATAKWETTSQPSNREVFEYLRQRARGGVPRNPHDAEIDAADKSLQAAYQVAYVQHVPMETRTALAQWEDGKLTVWTGTQNPFGYHRELAGAFGLANDQVRVIVPDFGCGFGGKHSGEAAIEAARLARAAGRPVSLKWTREEEFTWAYFRPAAAIDAAATLDEEGKLTSWHFVNINSGRSAVDTPYRAGKTDCQYVASDSPLRQGSYRVLAATANNFARECFMDELAEAAGTDPLDFRLRHLEEPRLRAVLEEAARQFDWSSKVKRKEPGVGVGLACGTEKGSVVAACVQITVDQALKRIKVDNICEVFECGAIINPDNLMAQVQGCIIMGLGPALREEMRFAGGKMRTTSLADYHVPRFSDVPKLDIQLLNRPDLPSVGAGETPIIALAPAIANAVFHATGKRIREMPIRV